MNYKQPENDIWSDRPYQMTCGSHEAEIRTYKKLTDPSGNIWLVANQDGAASNIYFHNPKDHNSQGFAGRVITFPLEDGTSYAAKGPWHTNSDALFKATGHDVRNKYPTFVVLAKQRLGSYPTQLKEILYCDKEPTLGTFDRYKEIIKQFPEAKFYFSGSSGGSSCGPCN